MQNEITERCEIPNKEGKIDNPGFARTRIMEYKRNNVKASWLRRKEWDYYLFTNERFALAFTISDLGYVGLLSVSFIDLINGTEHTETELNFLPRGKKYGLGTEIKQAGGHCHTKRLDLVYRKKDDHRFIKCHFKDFDGTKDLDCELDVYDTFEQAMYIATPWKEKPTAFYYNCKYNNLEAEGFVKYGNRYEKIERETTLGCLDWGRGVWTYDNTWFWGTGSGRVGKEAFGFNLGYGFSDRTAASENCVYYQGKIHKLDEVTFNIPKNDKNEYQYMDTWSITSNDKRFEGTFVPIIDRNAFMDFKVILTNQHQVFGKMTGYAILDSGEKIEFKDYICALEVVRNKY